MVRLLFNDELSAAVYAAILRISLLAVLINIDAAASKDELTLE